MDRYLAIDDKSIRDRFYGLRNFDDLAEILEVSKEVLEFYLYRTDLDSHYREFSIGKRRGGSRVIHAPVTPLKILQSKINHIFRQVVQEKNCVHGYARNKSIVSNALGHQRKNWVLNIDLADFFPSIHYGRVRGMLMARPYNLPRSVAHMLARICCYQGRLPQGGPASPVISNMVCGKMDDDLRELAKSSNCLYTRYSDDITFSTNLKRFPNRIAHFSVDENRYKAGPDLLSIINNNGFQINEDKVGLYGKWRRQQVTGITVNRRLNVRRALLSEVRAMLHAWETFGLNSAEQRFQQRFSQRSSRPNRTPPSFRASVRGKIEYIGFVRGRNDRTYLAYLNQYCSLAGIDMPATYHTMFDIKPVVRPIIVTEGMTDWMHLKAAHIRFAEEGSRAVPDVDFDEYDLLTPSGASEMLSRCKFLSTARQERPYIFVFDSDEKHIVHSVTDGEKKYKDWGNNVYSFAIPTPIHRINSEGVCIELYYQDKDIMTSDEYGRRLYLSTEFDPESSWHYGEDLVLWDRNKLKNQLTLQVIDDKVGKRGRNNVALSKTAFASNVYNKVKDFEKFDITHFGMIFDVISEICRKIESSKSQ